MTGLACALISVLVVVNVFMVVEVGLTGSSKEIAKTTLMIKTLFIVMKLFI